MTSTDVHTHLAPSLSASVEGVLLGDDDRLVVDGHVVGAPGLYDVERLLGQMQRHGVDEAWVSAPPPFFRPGLAPAQAQRWAQALDAGLQDRVAGHPELRRLTYVPLDHPGVALEMVEGAVGNAGWAASAGGGSLAMDSPELAPVWDAIDRRGLPVLLHPGESPDERLGRHYLANLLGNPVETGLAVAELVLGGVLTRHPGLRVVLVHCGGVVPSLVGRWARGVATDRPGIVPGAEDPAVVVRRLWTDCLAHSPEVVDLARTTFGDEHLLLGSDYPFPMGVDDPFDTVAHLSPSLQQRIAGNAEALLTAKERA